MDIKRAGGILAAGFGFTGLAAAAYAHWVEPFTVKVHRHEIGVSGLGAGLDGFTIAQLTDIHIKPWMLRGFLDKVARRVNSLAPDVIALTGDYVFLDSDFELLPELEDFLLRLQPKVKKLSILGNHDHWTNASAIRELLASANFVDLSNAVEIFSSDGAGLAIAGLDDPWEKKDRVEQVLPRLPEGVPALLMVHEPDYAPKYARCERFFLQISGHSHGGQISLPWLGPPVVPEHARRYRAGMYRVGGMLLYVSRGIGSVPFRMRFNCAPEITLFTLRSA